MPPIGATQRSLRSVASDNGLTDGLTTWWKLNSGSGSTAVDSEDGNDGAITGASWTETAKTGGEALLFDGVDDKVDTTISSISNPATLTLWVYPHDTDSNKGLFTNYNASNNDFFYHLQNDGSVTLSPDEWSGASGGSYSDSTWQHFAVVLTSDGDLYNYIDASQVASSTGNPDSSWNSGANFHIGNNANDSYPMDGIIDDVRLYNRALTSSEIQEIFDSTK